MEYNKKYLIEEIEKIKKLKGGEYYNLFYKNPFGACLMHKVVNMGGFYKIDFLIDEEYICTVRLSNVDEVIGAIKTWVKENLDIDL